MKPLFPTITPEICRDYIALARRTPNTIRQQIRHLTTNQSLTAESSPVRCPTREPNLPPQRIKIGPQ